MSVLRVHFNILGIRQMKRNFLINKLVLNRTRLSKARPVKILPRFLGPMLVCVNAYADDHSAKSAPSLMSHRTLEQCASLLPKGYEFKFSISGEVDTRGVEPVQNGRLDLSNVSGKNAEQVERLVQPYVECAKMLIKGASK